MKPAICCCDACASGTNGANRQTPAAAVTSGVPAEHELLAGFGESDLARQRIPLGAGTVRVQGSGIPAAHTVWLAGRQVPVGPQGTFVVEEILPPANFVAPFVVCRAGKQAVPLASPYSARGDPCHVRTGDDRISLG